MKPTLKLGQLNQEEYELAQARIAEFKSQAPSGHNLFEVAVAVYVNGRLQYHGGHTVGTNGSVLDRDLAKIVAMDCLKQMDDKGECTLEESNEERKHMTLQELLDLKAKDENKALGLVLGICPNRLRGVDVMNMTVGELRDLIQTDEEHRYVKAMAAFNGVYSTSALNEEIL